MVHWPAHGFGLPSQVAALGLQGQALDRLRKAAHEGIHPGLFLLPRQVFVKLMAILGGRTGKADGPSHGLAGLCAAAV